MPLSWTSRISNESSVGYSQHQQLTNQQSQSSTMVRQHDFGNKQSLFNGQTSVQFARERSASNRNLPDTNRLQAQQRRASDEIAGGASQRSGIRLSPAASRRSISVMNVGDGHLALLSRPSSRLGSQGSIMRARRDSSQLILGSSPNRSHNSISQQKQLSDSQTKLAGQADSPPVGMTPAGRRSSLVGIQTMIGYKTPKNSQSDSTEQQNNPGNKSAVSTQALQMRSTQTGAPKVSSLTGAASEQQQQQQVKIHPTNPHHHRGSISGTLQPATSGAAAANTQATFSAEYGTSTGSNSGTNSRRNSGDQRHPPMLQRKDSFAMMTLRKLKRTMSLTKGSDHADGQSGSGGQRSRRSSDSSASSTGSHKGDSIETDLGVTRRVLAHTSELSRYNQPFISTFINLEDSILRSQSL